MSENDSLGKNENFLEQIIKDDLGNSHSQNQLRFRFHQSQMVIYILVMQSPYILISVLVNSFLLL